MTETSHERTPMAVLCCEVSGLSLPPGPRGEELEKRLASDSKFFRELIQRHSGKLTYEHANHIEVLFPTAQSAMLAAISMQELIFGQNAGLSSSAIRLKYRIGIDFGDVQFLDGRARGPAADTARQLEKIAAPGKICFSDVVHEMTESHGELELKSAGLQSLGDRVVSTWMGKVTSDPEPLDLSILRRRSRPSKASLPEKLKLIEWTPRTIGVAAVVAGLLVFGTARSFQSVRELVGERNSQSALLSGTRYAERSSTSGLTVSFPLLPGVTLRLVPRRGQGFRAVNRPLNISEENDPRDDDSDEVLTTPNENDSSILIPTIVPTSTSTSPTNSTPSEEPNQEPQQDSTPPENGGSSSEAVVTL